MKVADDEMMPHLSQQQGEEDGLRHQNARLSLPHFHSGSAAGVYCCYQHSAVADSGGRRKSPGRSSCFSLTSMQRASKRSECHH